MNPVLTVFLHSNTRTLPKLRYHITPIKGDRQMNFSIVLTDRRLHLFQEARHSFTCLSRSEDAIIGRTDLRNLAEEIDLVVTLQDGGVLQTNLVQHLIHGLSQRLMIGMRNINHVQDQIGLEGLFECGMKGRHQGVRELADKSNGVAQEKLLTLVKGGFANQ